MVRFATLLSCILGVLSSTGCHALLGIDDFTTADASIDVPLPDVFMVDAQSCFGTLTPVCIAPPTLGTIIIAGTLDTTSDPRCDVHPQAGGPDLCVIAGGQISIENTVVSGDRALVFIGTGSVTVNGAIDASSDRTIGHDGPGSVGVECDTTQNGEMSDTGGGGGAGGSFGTVGAAGGAGAGGTGGGVMGPTMNVAVIRGGCAGGLGGRGSAGPLGFQGRSGGAIALLSGSQISIIATGSVYASGSGGGPGAVTGAGGAAGGAGSGGLIVLEAPSIQILGTVSAHGGGGGGGGATSSGHPGEKGATVIAGTPASGGAPQGPGLGGAGGTGSSTTGAALAGSAPASGGSGGGGGGGGGAGVVWMHGTLSGGAKISPAPQMH